MNSKLLKADEPLTASEIVDLDLHRAKQLGFRVPASARTERGRQWRSADGKVGRPRKEQRA